MTTNRERAEAILTVDHLALDIDDCELCRAVADAIEAALDEAEKRGHADGYALGQEAVRRNPASGVAELNAILDEVVEMGRCDNCLGGERAKSICRDCNGTGDGPLARMVKEARG